MLLHSIGTQLKTMLVRKEFRFAFFILLIFSCYAFLFALSDVRDLERVFGVEDLSVMFDANQVVCFAVYSRLWNGFAMAYPFLLVLPFATSYVDDYKSQLLPAYLSRCSRSHYYISKVVVCFIGTAIVFAIPFLINLILCNAFCPHNNHTVYGEYLQGNYYRTLLGTNLLYQVDYPEIPFLRVYLYSPFVYNLLCIMLFSAFSGLLAAAVMSISFLLRKSRLLLFVPIFAVNKLLQTYDIRALNSAVESGGKYTNYDLMDYLLPTLFHGQDPRFLAVVLAVLAAVIISFTLYGIKHDMASLQ